MKMPTRRWFTPVNQRPDIFGLHYVTIAGAACEGDVERAKRFAKVEAGITGAFKAAVHHVGDERARQLFRKALRRPKRGPGRALAADRDRRLLAAYDAAVKDGETIASIGRRLHTRHGIELGNTPAAIEAHIRRLVKVRKQSERAAAFEARRRRMAMRNEPPTLASGRSHDK
jgi:hypothetical protein